MVPVKWLRSLFLLMPGAVHSQSSPTVSGSTTLPGRTSAPAYGGSTSTPTGTSTSYRPVFTVPASADLGATLIPNIQDPEAVDPQSVCPGYKAANVQASPTGLTAELLLAGKACNVYGIDIDSLKLTVEYQTAERLQISIVPTFLGPTNTSWFTLPEYLVPAPKMEGGNQTVNDLTFSWSNDPSFNFNVTRASTGAILFSTADTKLVYENQFIEFVSSLPENYNLYGLGETIHGVRLGNNFTKTMFAADIGDPIDYNIYGSHPFFLDTRYYEVDSEGNQHLITSNSTAAYDGEYRSYSHGGYLRNAHAQEILLRPSNITWRTLGGSIDLYFFSGPNQPEVTAQYLDVIGLPAMQAYHTFGFHQCKWGYANWSEVEEVVDNYAKFGIPLEHIWTDIDYMHFYRDFENDPVRYNYTTGQEFLSRLHANGQYYTPIIDSAIYIPNPLNASDSYPTFTNGNESNAFLLNPDGSLYIGEVWPGYTVFPDWLANNTESWWINEMVEWHNKIAFDGAWLDMSEVSSFCVGSCGSGNLSLNPVHPGFSLPGEPLNIIYDYPEGFNLTNATEASSVSAASASQSSASAIAAGSTSGSSSMSTSTSYLRTTPTSTRNVDHPPYVINNVQGDLGVHAVAPNATHHDGTLEYDVHNLFGHGIIRATYNALLAISAGKRPFIIGRSTFAGSGVYAGHWGGDNASKWYYMFFSIPQALSFSLFGIPMFGVDTCGFNGNSDEELCNRWMQLSAFFPFYRNHNELSTHPQEAYRWASVIDATKSAMAVRFALLPYIYTLFHQAHTTGSTVMRALAWNFPHDPSLASADRQFFLGDAILVTPVLVQGATNVSGVFPGLAEGTDIYYDWYTHTPLPVPSASDDKNITLPAPLGHIPVHIRGNTILATQSLAPTTRAARLTPWSLLIALDVTSTTAYGSLYLDDGESLVPSSSKSISFSVTNSTLTTSITGLYAGDTNPLANITVLGLKSAPAGQLMFNNTPVPITTTTDSGGTGGGVVSVYNASTQTLSVSGLEGLTREGGGGVWMQGDWTFGW